MGNNKRAAIAQPVERILGKDEVSSSILDSSSKLSPVIAMIAGLIAPYEMPMRVESGRLSDAVAETDALFTD
jgi:hypothetical protein